VDERLNQRAEAAARGLKSPQSIGRWRAIQDEFLLTGQASRVQNALTIARNELLIEAYRAAIEPVFPQSVAMLASGAYGRGQTFPYSELEIVLLLESGKQSGALKERLPGFVRTLWEAGLRVNSAVLTVAECLEAVERGSLPGVGLLGRRLLAGDRALAERLEGKLPAALASHSQKMSQHLCQLARERHARYRNTPHHRAPDVAEGPGGFEDLRLIDSLAILKTEREGQSTELMGASAMVSSVRCFLHYRAECDRNILDFEAQEGLAHQAFSRGKDSSGWMREYFQSARTIFNAARRAIEGTAKIQSSLLETFREYRSRLSNQEFTVSRERMLLRNPAHLAADPSLAFRMIEFIGCHGVAPASDTERRLESSRGSFKAWCAEPRPLWATLKTILGYPHAAMALRTLESTGLLRELFPEWRAIEHLVTTDSEYRYTVGEHALQTIERVIELTSAAAPERQRFAGLLSEIDDVTLLLFTLLFHEMGRGEADPVSTAAERARQAMVRIQMPDDAQNIVEFLIRHQSDLADAVSGRDMDDPATARFLAERAGTIERLKMLAVMAYARIVALGAEAKTPWRLEQLWRAYSVAQHELIRELETDRIQQVPEDLPGHAGFIKGFPLRYLRAHSPELSRPTGVAVRLEPLEGVYRLTVVARDKVFLFASFAAAISSFGLDILKAEAFSNTTGVVLDTFIFADPKRLLQQNPTEADRLNDLIQRIALGKTNAQRLMRDRALPEAARRATPPQVRFDSEACPTATLVEIETEDRPGLLYSLATVFSSNVCNIDVVLVDTKGHRAIDVFYVAHQGAKLSQDMQASLKEKLLAAC
jgi:[protein-PII] uridylyltransferase